MKIRKIARGMGSWVMVFAFSSWLSAQTVEVNPYAGGLFTPNSIDTETGSFDLKEEGLYGIRASFFPTENVEIEGNFGYINHFEFEESDPESRGYLWEASGSYRFDQEGFKPFLIVGIGGITASVDEDEPGFLTATTPVFEGGDTFFTFSYGGGVKTPQLWGPLGLRGDIRGRTIPNLLGEALTWLELTGGLTFTF